MSVCRLQGTLLDKGNLAIYDKIWAIGSFTKSPNAPLSHVPRALSCIVSCQSCRQLHLVVNVLIVFLITFPLLASQNDDITT